MTSRALCARHTVFWSFPSQRGAIVRRFFLFLSLSVIGVHTFNLIRGLTECNTLDAKPPRRRRRSAGRKRETTGGAALGHCRRACCPTRECKPLAFLFFFSFNRPPLGFFLHTLYVYFFFTVFRRSAARHSLGWLPRGEHLPSCKANSRHTARVTPFG